MTAEERKTIRREWAFALFSALHAAHHVETDPETVTDERRQEVVNLLARQAVEAADALLEAL